MSARSSARSDAGRTRVPSGQWRLQQIELQYPLVASRTKTLSESGHYPKMVARIFQIMIPSIASVKQDHRKRPHRLSTTAFICGLSALLAFLVTLLIFLSVKAHKSREVITYQNFHPRKLQTLQSEDVFLSVKTTAIFIRLST